MRQEFFAVQLVGAAVSLAGAVCLAMLPLPDFHWYTRREQISTRVIVVLMMGFATTFVCLAGLWNVWFHGPFNQMGIALGLGLPFIVILFVVLRVFLHLYPTVSHRRHAGASTGVGGPSHADWRAGAGGGCSAWPAGRTRLVTRYLCKAELRPDLHERAACLRAILGEPVK